jgi:alkylation response protein AidB-like acyl-CoA dehydrogenase
MTVLSPEQRQFAATLHDLLGAADTVAAARAWDAGDHRPGLALWKRLAALGVTALAVPEKWDGVGAHPLDLVVAVEELGHHAVPGPVVESLAAVPAHLAAGGDLADNLLPSLVQGEPVTLPGVTFAGQAADLGSLACAAQLLGAGRALLEQSVAYARTRVQFGSPIGRFQAVKHQLADVAIGLAFARPLLYAAATALGDGVPTAGRDVSAAKVACAAAAYRAARTGLQVHGAIGYTQEYPLGLWILKVRALMGDWGTNSWHRERILASL